MGIQLPLYDDPEHVSGIGQSMSSIEFPIIDSNVTWPPKFVGFPKIPRLNREILATEKIDGTNASVYIDEHKRIAVGSRNRWLTAEHDNHGFFQWVMEHKEELIEGLGPGHHYGEYWGHKIQRGYGLTERRFSLFNLHRWGEGKAPACCHVVPVVARGIDISLVRDQALNTLRQFGSIAAPGFDKPEGIVLYHVAGHHLYKVSLENDAEPKGKKR